MRNYFIRLITSPVTHLFLLSIGVLILIEGLHLKAHYDMDSDVNGYVRNFCRKNLDICERIIEND